MTNQIELPRDAEGREIPLDTKVLYDKDGNEWHVERVEYSPHYHVWSFIVPKDGLNGFIYAEYAYLEKPAPPDSWEKLEEDLDRCIEADCVSLGVSLVLEDIKQRIRKLRGEGE